MRQSLLVSDGERATRAALQEPAETEPLTAGVGWPQRRAVPLQPWRGTRDCNE